MCFVPKMCSSLDDTPGLMSIYDTVSDPDVWDVDPVPRPLPANDIEIVIDPLMSNHKRSGKPLPVGHGPLLSQVVIRPLLKP